MDAGDFGKVPPQTAQKRYSGGFSLAQMGHTLPAASGVVVEAPCGATGCGAASGGAASAGDPVGGDAGANAGAAGGAKEKAGASGRDRRGDPSDGGIEPEDVACGGADGADCPAVDGTGPGVAGMPACGVTPF